MVQSPHIHNVQSVYKETERYSVKTLHMNAQVVTASRFRILIFQYVCMSTDSEVLTDKEMDVRRKVCLINHIYKKCVISFDTSEHYKKYISLEF